MLKLLVKKQLAEIFRSYLYDAKKSRARSRASTILYFLLFALLMIGLVGGSFTFLSLMLCTPLRQAGMDWLYFTLMGLIAIFLGVFGSVFNTYSTLYLAKDNDLLLSLPVPVHAIVASRLLSVYLMGLMYSGVVIVPAVLVYWFRAGFTPGSVGGGVLLTLLISLFVLTLSCLLGWVVAKVSLRLRSKSFITVLLSLLFLGAYYFFYFKAQGLISDLIANAAVYGPRIRGAAYPLYLLGLTGVGDVRAMLLCTAVFALAFGLMWRLLSRSFLSIATASARPARRREARRAEKRRSVPAALLGKELARFTASPNYMLNCGLGVLLLPAGGVVLLLKADSFLPTLQSVFDAKEGAVAALILALICALATMNDMAAPSVSLEGKTLWLSQSLPLRPWQALQAKLSMQLLLSGVPTLVCALLVAAAGAFHGAELLLGLAVLAGFTLFSALSGLCLGLKLPVLHWTSEIYPIKQSACVALALLINFLYPIVLGGGYLLFGYRLGFAGYMGLFAAGTFLLSALLLLWLRKKGAAIFASL